MSDKINELKQRCLEQIDNGLTKDLEAPYIQAYALLLLAERVPEVPSQQEEKHKLAQESGGTKKVK
jgi:hypothetical protein